jgi:hypothetical protein
MQEERRTAMIATQKIHRKQYSEMGGILVLSAWGFATVIASFLFFWAGLKLDSALGTGPYFMIGLFMLAIFLCVMRLYQEAKRRMKDF